MKIAKVFSRAMSKGNFKIFDDGQTNGWTKDTALAHTYMHAQHSLHYYKLTNKQVCIHVVE